MRTTGQIVQHPVLCRLLECESLNLFAGSGPVHLRFEVWKPGLVLGGQLERGRGRVRAEELVAVGERSRGGRDKGKRRRSCVMKQCCYSMHRPVSTSTAIGVQNYGNH